MVVSLLLRAVAVFSLLAGLAVGKVKVGLIGVVPLAVRMMWMDGQLLAAALVFPTVNIALGGSTWTTPYKLLLSLAMLRVIWKLQQGSPLRMPPLGISVSYGLLLIYVLLLEMTSGSDPFLTVFSDGASSLLVLGIMTQLVRGPGVLRRMLMLVNVATFLQLTAVAYEIYQHGNAKRCLGLSGQPNLLGSTVGMMLPISLGAALSCPERQVRLVSALAVCCGLYVIMASGSRGGMVAALVGAVSIVFLSSRSLRQVLIRVSLGVTLMFAVIPIAPKMYEERILKTVAASDSTTEDRTSGRLEQIDTIVMLIEQQSLFGEGMGGYLDHAARNHLGKRTLPHSSIMGIAVAWGVLTALFWVIVQFSAVRATMLLRGRLGVEAWYANGLIGALLSSFSSSLSSPSYFSASLWGLVFLSHVLLHTTPRLAGRHPVTDYLSPRPRARGPAKPWQPSAPVPTSQPL